MTFFDYMNYNKYDVISGHVSRTDQLKWFRDRDIITLLREPIDRCLSFIHYIKSLNIPSLEVVRQAHNLPLKEWIDTPSAQQNLNNTMVRQLGGHMLDDPDDLPALLEKAKVTLLEALWVGRQETLDRDVIGLSQLLKCHIRPVRVNETPGRPPRASEPAEMIDRLYAMNSYDLQLWNWAQENIF